MLNSPSNPTGAVYSKKELKDLAKVLINHPNVLIMCDDIYEKITYENFIFSNGIDFIYEFFNFESKLKNTSLSKSIQLIGKNPILNKFFTNIADKGF